MNHTHELAVAGKTSGLIDLHETVTWRARHFGIYLTLTVKITAMQKPAGFTDEMQQGPFLSLKHQHIFSAGSEGTIMYDIFEFRSPFGLLGRMFDYFVLKSYMTKLLVRRNLVLKSIAESDGWKDLVS